MKGKAAHLHELERKRQECDFTEGDTVELEVTAHAQFVLSLRKMGAATAHRVF